MPRIFSFLAVAALVGTAGLPLHLMLRLKTGWRRRAKLARRRASIRAKRPLPTASKARRRFTPKAPPT